MNRSSAISIILVVVVLLAGGAGTFVWWYRYSKVTTDAGASTSAAVSIPTSTSSLATNTPNLAKVETKNLGIPNNNNAGELDRSDQKPGTKTSKNKDNESSELGDKKDDSKPESSQSKGSKGLKPTDKKNFPAKDQPIDSEEVKKLREKVTQVENEIRNNYDELKELHQKKTITDDVFAEADEAAKKALDLLGQFPGIIDKLGDESVRMVEGQLTLIMGLQDHFVRNIE